NFDNQVILYDFKNDKEKRILKPLFIETSEIETIIPTNFIPLETSVVNRACTIIKCTIVTFGKESYGIRFALFENFNALGYFEFPLLLSVQ
ncbi:MAG: hypothetical protein EOO44_09275, partial [Flavobacterium sp.]